MTCQHPNVRSDASETGIRVWACDDCRVRFAPAPLDGLRAALLAEGIEAFRLTRAYVGEDTLPALPGWSWFDWTEKALAALRDEGETP